ncbi:MAG: BrnT family toxin, partial [Actinobacteria bacterium]|nr:BrnT family toxin [Actinomycetota bacterium]
MTAAGHFEWDEVKAASNLEKHGIDFQGAVRIFETEAILWVYSERQGEGRWKAIG